MVPDILSRTYPKINGGTDIHEGERSEWDEIGTSYDRYVLRFGQGYS